MNTYIRDRRGDPRFKNKPWIAIVDYGIVRGRRRRPEKAFRTREEARDYLLTVGGSAPPAEGTVGALLEAWLRAGREVDGWSPSHAERSGRLVAYDLKPLHGMRAADLTVQDIEELLADRRADGLAHASVQHIRKALSAAYNLAIRRQQARFNPAALAKVPGAPKRKRDRPMRPHHTPEQARDFLAALEGERLAPLLTTALALALRPGEAIGLWWEDWDADVLHVRRQIQKVGDEWHDLDPKAESERDLPVPAFLQDLLAEHRKKQNEERLRLKPRADGREKWKRPELVFTNRQGGELNEVYCNKVIRRVCERADVPKITFYGLRHTGATLQLAMGAPIEQIRDMLGHANIATTLRYVHVLEDQRRQSAERLDEWMSGT